MGAALLLAGILGLNETRSRAGDPVPVLPAVPEPTQPQIEKLIPAPVPVPVPVVDANTFIYQGFKHLPICDFNHLMNQDIRHILATIDSGVKGGKHNIARSARGMKSSALMIVLYTNVCIDGTDQVNDIRMATLRSAAFDIASAAEMKKFAIDPQLAILMQGAPASTPVDPRPMPTEALIDEGKLDVEDLMHQFKSLDSGGLGAKEDLRVFAKKFNGAFGNARTLSYRVLGVSEYLDVLAPKGGFSAKKPQDTWITSNNEMREGAIEALIEMRPERPDCKKIEAAFTKVYDACAKCHKVFD